MGAGCCRCYKVPTTDETKVQQTITSSDKDVPPQPINAVNSVSVSTSPIPNGQQNGKSLNQRQQINGMSSTNHHHHDNSGDIEIDERLKQRLIEFYKIHNPSKLNNEAAIHEICKRYKDREEKLFSDLNNKYSQKKIENKASEDHHANTPQVQEDENSPLTAKSNTTSIDKPTIKLPLDVMANNSNKKGASPQSTSKRKQKKHSLADESPPESDDYDEEQDLVNSHPIMMDMDVESESTPIVTHKKMMIDIDDYNHNQKKDKLDKKTPSTTNEKLANLPFPGFKKESFKIEVTKPMKKKPLGTNLFGTPSAGSRKKDDFGKPIFKNNSSNSFSNSRSTSFIGTPFDSTNGQVPTLNIARSHTLTLDSSHKSSLDKRRQSSLAVRRNQNRRNLPIRINKVWAVFAQYIIDKMLEENGNGDENQKENKKKKSSKKRDENLNDIEEDIEATPEPEEAFIDTVINNNSDNNTNDPPSKRKKGHESMEVLDIDPRLFVDAKNKSRRNSNRSSTSSNKSSSDEDDESSDGGLNIDVYEIEISYAQFNIVLNNANIAVSPDMSAALVWLLLDVNKMLDAEIKSLGQESDNLHNNPMKERGFHSKQFKKIYKCKINYQMIDTLMKHLNNGSVGRQDKSLHPKHLSYEKRNLVIWDKIFEHLINKTSFNIEEEYLYGALQEEELRDGDKIIDMLSTLESHWQHRVQLMEHIDDKLNSGSDMERDIFFASILSNNDNFIHVLTGWSCQLTDDRSGVARTAVTLLPAVLSSILLCIQYPASLFNEKEVIHPIYDGIFTLVKNRRLKDMADDAYESLIQVTDVFAEVASHLQDYQLLSIIIKVLEDHTNPKIEKHDKCRESCIGGMGFLLYGIEPPSVVDETNDDEKNEKNNKNKKSGLLENPIDEDKAMTPFTPTTPIGLLSQKDTKHDDDEKIPDIPDHIRGLSLGLQKANGADKTNTKLSKIMQREYLLKNEQFVTAFGNMLKYGVTDKSESGRRKAFKLLQRLENEKEGKLLAELQDKWDFTVQKKYKNWKKLNERKKNSSIKGGKNRKKSQRKSSKKGKGKGKSLKNQVKKKKSVDNTKKDKEKEKDKEKDIKFTEKNKTNDNDHDNDNNEKTTISNTRITITSDDADKTN